MLIKLKRANDILSSQITSETSYLNRRQFIEAAGTLMAGSLLASCADSNGKAAIADQSLAASAGGSTTGLDYRSAAESTAGFSTDEALTPFKDVTSYNNFYEFGTDKSDPKRYAKSLVVKPWAVAVEGEAEKTGTFNLEDILSGQSLQERIYRLRCVEAWSMVIPWIGFPLSALIKRFNPTSRAKYVAFETVYRPAEMRGQRSRFSTIDWPYVEGLRMDEAMHPLTILAVGLYGRELPNQNGAPLRLVVPWKYGFKSIKSIVKIRFTERQPATSWNQSAPHEYGFYSNVNPQVDHPRWSQATERRLPSSLLNPQRVATLPFNGYAEQVAGLYTGMDLRRNF